ncbi:hypothetical protein N9Y91_02750 [Alphaproteobacteria bacterium]|nr:hypothetical protein [Alphaproteobacteria bacterium]
MINFDYNFFKKNKMRLSNARDGGRFKDEKKALEQHNAQLNAALENLQAAVKKRKSLESGIAGSEFISLEDSKSELGDISDKIKGAEKHLTALTKNFLASEDSESLTKRDHLRGLLNTCQSAEVAVDGLFQNIKRRFKNTSLQYCDQPNIIEVTIVMTDHNKEKHKEYLKLYDKYDHLFNDWSIDNFASQRGVLESAAREIRKIRTEFDEDYPDFAKQFLEDAKGKAVPLGSITEELLTWLREYNLIDKYSVTKR